MHNEDGKALPSCLYPIKYFNESLLSDFLSDNAILSISTSLILMGFSFLWKTFFMMPFSLKEIPSFILWKESKVKVFYYLFLASL